MYTACCHTTATSLDANISWCVSWIPCLHTHVAAQDTESFVSFSAQTQKDIEWEFGGIKDADAQVKQQMELGAAWDQLALKFEVTAHERMAVSVRDTAACC